MLAKRVHRQRRVHIRRDHGRVRAQVSISVAVHQGAIQSARQLDVPRHAAQVSVAARRHLNQRGRQVCRVAARRSQRAQRHLVVRSTRRLHLLWQWQREGKRTNDVSLVSASAPMIVFSSIDANLKRNRNETKIDIRV